MNGLKEVVDLHQFFEDWFGGRIAPTEENFRRFSGVHPASFQLVSPDGNTLDAGPLVERLRKAHNTRPGFRLWIEKAVQRPLSTELCLVTYEEWQESDGHVTARVSSATLQRREGAPNGLEWLHVHETWRDLSKG